MELLFIIYALILWTVSGIIGLFFGKNNPFKD